MASLRTAGRRTLSRVKDENVPLLAAGTAFFGMLALFPALIALVTLYGLVADPQQATEQVRRILGGVSPEMQRVVLSQIETVTSSKSGLLTIGLAVSVVGLLWTASSGMANLVKGLTIAFGGREERGFVKLRATALAATAVALVMAALAIGSIVLVPVVVDRYVPGEALRWVLRGGRWVILGAVTAVALAGLYRYTPDRERPAWRWVTPGAVVATLLWIAGSIGFSFYVQNLGNYGNTYGALAGVIVLMLWLYVTSLVILVGAVLDAELERTQAPALNQKTGQPEPTGTRPR